MKLDIKSFLTYFLTAISLIAIAVYLFRYYEFLNFSWWVIPTSFGIISLLNILVPIYKKPLFFITLTGFLIYSFYLVEELYIRLGFSDTFILFFIKVMVTLTLASLTEYIVAELSLSNVILDFILGAIAILLHNNVSIVVQEDSSWIPLIKLIILLVYSFMVVMIDNPMKVRKLGKD